MVDTLSNLHELFNTLDLHLKANYSYLSDGTKAAAFTSASAGIDYVGSFTYTRGNNNSRTLESIAFGGGRIRKSGSTYAVDYNITDHLGSVRAIVNTSGTIQEQNDYYPFGMRHPNGLTQLAANRWRFSGKEEQDAAFGIAYSDFGARFYDRSAAWTTIDPMSEKFYEVSPYTYSHNDPINRFDYDGNIDWRLIKKGAIGLGSSASTAIIGVAITGGSGGVASPAGTVMVVDGVVGILLGATYILTGLLTSPSEEADRLIEIGPSDVTNTLAKSGDLMVNNQHQEFEIATDLLKIGIGFGITKGENAHLIESLPALKKALIKGSSYFQFYDILQKMTGEDPQAETEHSIVMELPKEEEELDLPVAN